MNLKTCQESQVLNYLMSFFDQLKDEVEKHRKFVIWMWFKRNEILFKEEFFNFEDTIFHIKVLSLIWLVIGFKGKSLVNLYD